MDTIIRIGGATVNQTPFDWQGNLRNILQAIKNARGKKIEILCFPELSISGYGCEDMFLSSWLPEKATRLLPEVAAECEGILVVVGFPFWNNGKLFNCAGVIQNKKIIGIYAKKYLAREGVHYEPRWFSPRENDGTTEVTLNGDTVPFGNFQFTYRGIRAGFEICEDAWTGPVRPAGRLHEQGVGLILNPSASHFSMKKPKQRYELVLKSSADFECTYVYANLLGNEAGRMIYDGEILISQEGRPVAYNKLLSFLDFNVVSADINFTNADRTSRQINPNTYLPNEEFVAAASLGLFDYLRKSRNRGFVLSLSGGADSSCCAVLVSEMIRRGMEELGRETFLEKAGRQDLSGITSGLPPEQARKMIVKNLLCCAYQGSDNSSHETLQSARLLAEDTGAVFFTWNISDEALSYTKKIEKVLGRSLDWKTDDIVLQNIQARARSPIIWMLANARQSILLTTSNRSEGDLGYATMDGDTSGSLAPIAAVDKHFLRQWLKWAEGELGYPSLAYVNQLIPTAELRPPGESQSDEKDLMPYSLMVIIEEMGIRDKMSPKDIFAQLKNQGLAPEQELREYIRKFFRLWSANQWKRERTAPAFHLDDFNIDPRTWCRFPILSGSFRDELNELDSV